VYIKKLRDMTKYTFDLDQYATNIEMREFDDIAQIFVNGKLLTEYKFGGAGCYHIYHADNKKLIDLLVGILYDKGNPKVETEFGLEDISN
jgi:hypothetical protein